MIRSSGNERTTRGWRASSNLPVRGKEVVEMLKMIQPALGLETMRVRVLDPAIFNIFFDATKLKKRKKKKKRKNWKLALDRLLAYQAILASSSSSIILYLLL